MQGLVERRWRRATVAWALGLGLALSQSAAAEPTSAPETTSAQAPRFILSVQAPDAVQALLLKHLDLQRFRNLDDLDATELSQLLGEAPDQINNLLGTQGYFAPQVQVSHAPQDDRAPLGAVAIEVAPGPRTQVASAQAYLRGDVQHNAAAAAQRQRIEQQLQQRVGRPFTQSDWDAAKGQALRQLTSERYPRARLVNSLSDVNSEAGQAHWYVELDSGDPVRIGEVRVVGHERYDPDIARRMVRLAGLEVGADYSLSALQTAQQRIADTAYYTSVFAYADLDAAAADGQGRAPVIVQVAEALPQKLVWGVGGSTDSGPRLSFEHNHLWVPGIHWRARQALQWDGKQQSLNSVWQSPLDDKGWHWLVDGSWQRQVDGSTTVRGTRLSVGRSQESEALDRRYYLQFDRSRTVDSASLLASSDGSESSISANLGWTWRRFEHIPFPDGGHGLGLKLGAGTTLGVTRTPFVTAHARWLSYWPLADAVGTSAQPSADDAPRPRSGRLALRLEAGAVMAKPGAPIPDTLLFWAGGDNSVRGYGLHDIGQIEADGSITAGRYLAVASFEWQQPIRRQGQVSDWESVVFVDAGAVNDRVSQMRAQVGLGVGARYISPVGPIEMDLAYGVQARRFRIHLNVGFSF
jgi:translocation and assembly module TamA